jgi:acetyl esterase/lipase
MKILFNLILCFAALSTMAQKVIALYPDEIPNAIEGPDQEQNMTDGWARYNQVSNPTLKIYLPPKDKANGTAVVVCPGGGYAVVAYQHEGDAVAEELNKIGVAAIILKYRMPNDKTMVDKSIGPLQDAQQAIRVVRMRAKEWNINPERIGIAGFSAGGHLASTAATHYSHALVKNRENINLRPDFMILIYPVVSFTDSLAHLGSRENLIGKNPTLDKIKLYSNELQVNKDTPHAFIVHAEDDETVKVENSLRFYEALKKNNIPAELLVFPKGGHGFGLVNPTTDDRWFERCRDWLKSNGWLR